jgi:Fur family ferric uptake transcriptional regulator
MPADPRGRGELLERFRRWLRDRRLPITGPRDQVAQVVFGSTRHLSADDITAALRDRGTQIGTATVYRALDTLVEAGFARSHDFGEGFRRFEPLVPGERHGHLICSGCGRVTEFPLELVERPLALLADEHEFVSDRSRVELHGLCRDCRRRGPGALARAGRRR